MTSELSSRDYEREAEATRHRLADSLDELTGKLTPGQVFDEVLSYAKGGGGTFFRALSNAARENPVPSLLIGAGCMMFLSEKMGLSRLMPRSDPGDGRAYDAGTPSAFAGAGSRAAGAVGSAMSTAASGVTAATRSVRSGVQSAADFASEQGSKISDGVRRGTEAVGDAAANAARAASDTASGIREGIGSTAESLKRTAGQVGDTLTGYSEAIGEQVAETAEQARQRASQTAGELKNKATSLVNEQPLLVAAIGLAVGAVVAAMLPSTQTEDELVGQASDAVKNAVGEVVSDKFEAATTAVGKVVEEAQNVAQREGLTPSAAGDIARDLGDKLKRVVTETGAAAGAQVRDFASTDKS
jgi:ElaB/YqjD/DUF883 family membrane-anchored ribosome-binding protein